MVVRVVIAERLLSGVEEVLTINEGNGPLFWRARSVLSLIGGGRHRDTKKPCSGLLFKEAKRAGTQSYQSYPAWGLAAKQTGA